MQRKTWTKDEIVKIYNEEYIGRHIGCTTLSKKYNVYIYDQFKKYNLKLRNDFEKNRKYHCDSDYFKILDTEQKAYWYGFILADGCITSSSKKANKLVISLQEADYKHLEKFNIAINGNYPIAHYSITNGFAIGTKYCRISVNNNKIANDLIALGCVKNKSNIAKPPYELPYELRKHFIRGYMDGNGSIAITKGKNGRIDSYSIKFVSTDDILNWIMEHLLFDNVIKRKYPLYKRKKEQIVSTLEFGGNNLSLEFLNYIYKDATVWLERKYERYQSLLRLKGVVQYDK